MTKLLIAISFLLFLGSPFANAEQVYYCASELSVGITKDEKTGKWKSGKFKQEIYTIKFNDDYTKLDGLDSFTWNCKKPFEYLTEYQSVRVCRDDTDAGINFQFNKKTLRFFLSQTQIQGYLMNGNDTNQIYAGTCKKF